MKTAQQAAHTPGPWSFEAGEEYTVRGANKQIVFLIGDNRRAIPMGPDAKLICAAPELLELLTLALPSIEESEQFDKPTQRKVSKRVRELIESL